MGSLLLNGCPYGYDDIPRTTGNSQQLDTAFKYSKLHLDIPFETCLGTN